MADDNWQKIRKIFDESLRRKPEDRRNYVIEICGADKMLLAEIESLLTSLDIAQDFLETPAVSKIADVFEIEIKTSEIGKCFGHYEIIRQIGAGGMGEVYLASDKKLDRQVAVKILNEKFSRDESNLKRFIREAKAASALNHPNILTIYEFGESEDAHFIASEFIKGATLREVIKEKSFHLSEILDISIQIANALCTAHEAHLVHRDIKPENVMIRPDGIVKVLDFGLAKLVERKNLSFLGLNDLTSTQNETASGIILGTVNYMSPEQAKGERVDERTDIFSLGVVIYEMIAGKTPFAGDSVSERFANLINAEPPSLTGFSADVSVELERIIFKLLRKDKNERYQTTKDVLKDLKAFRENLSSEEKLERSAAPDNKDIIVPSTATTGGTNRQTAPKQNSFLRHIRQHKPLAAFALAGLFAVAIALSFYRSLNPQNTGIEHFRQVKLSRLTSIGNVGNCALSPDGNLIVYEIKEKEGVSVWVRQIEMSNSINLVPLKKGNITFLTFSPDGKLVYYGFFSGYDSTAELYSVPVLGGASRRIPNIITNYMSFAPDGKRYAQVVSNLKEGEKYLVVNALGSDEEIQLAVRKTPRSFNITGQFCAWSPDGQTIAVISNDTESNKQFSILVGVNVVDGTEKLLSAKHWNELGGVQWLKDGSGLLVLGSDSPQAQSQVWFVSAADGAARRLTNDLNDYSYIGITADAKQIVAVQESRTSGIWFGTVERNADDFKQLLSETGTLDTIAVTANDDIAFRSNADGKPNLWIIKADGGGRQQLTVDAEIDGRGLCAMPDAGQIVFPSRKAGKVNLWRVNADGGELRQLTFGDGEFFPVCLPNNQGVIYQKGSGYGIKSTLWKTSLDGGEPVQLTDYYAIRPAVSPDGSRVGFFYINHGKWSVGTVSADGGSIEHNFEVPDGVLDRTLRWSPETQSLLYIANEGNIGNLWSLPLNGQSPKQITKFDSRLLADFVLTRDGKRTAVTRTAKSSDIVSISED